MPVDLPLYSAWLGTEKRNSRKAVIESTRSAIGGPLGKKVAHYLNIRGGVNLKNMGNSINLTGDDFNSLLGMAGRPLIPCQTNKGVEKELEECKSNTTLLSTEITNKDALITSLRDEKSQEVDGLQKKLDEAEEESKKSHQEVEGLQKKLDNAEEESKKHHSERTNLSKELKKCMEKTTELGSVKAARDQCEERLKAALKALDDFKSDDSRKNAILLDENLQNLRKSEEELKKMLEESKSIIEDKNKTIDEHESSIQDKNKTIGEQNRVMEEQAAMIKSLTDSTLSSGKGLDDFVSKRGMSLEFLDKLIENKITDGEKNSLVSRHGSRLVIMDISSQYSSLLGRKMVYDKKRAQKLYESAFSDKGMVTYRNTDNGNTTLKIYTSKLPFFRPHLQTLADYALMKGVKKDTIPVDVKFLLMVFQIGLYGLELTREEKELI